MSRIGWERIEDLELKEEEDVGLRNRLRFLRILIIMILVLLLYRVWWIQHTRGPELASLATENQTAELQNGCPARCHLRPLWQSSGNQPTQLQCDHHPRVPAR